MVITIYKCDKCGKQQNESNQMWHVQLRVVYYEASGDYETPKLQSLWCRTCLDEAGLTPSKRKPEELKPVTLEDMVREIVRQEIPA